MEIHIPTAFISGVIAERGEAGRVWLDTLPERFAEACKAWGLVIDGDAMHGHLGFVIPVLRGTEKCVLKITWADELTRQEVSALQLWNGQGAVMLLDAKPDEGVLLLERLDAHRTLEDAAIDDAVRASGQLLRRLALPAPHDMPKLSQHVGSVSALMAERWQKYGKPFPEDLLKDAQAAALRLGASAKNLVVNYDLHYGNVLAGQRESWLVIDPKVIVGDPEYGIWPLLLRRPEGAEDRVQFMERLLTLVKEAGLDLDRAKEWTFVRAIDYWLWALSIGLTEDPKRCALISSWLTKT